MAGEKYSTFFPRNGTVPVQFIVRFYMKGVVSTNLSKENEKG